MCQLQGCEWVAEICELTLMNQGNHGDMSFSRGESCVLNAKHAASFTVASEVQLLPSVQNACTMAALRTTSHGKHLWNVWNLTRCHKLSSQVSLRPPEIQLTGKDDCARWSDTCWFRWFSWRFSVTMVQPGHCSLCCTWTCRRCCSPWLVLPQTPNLPDPSWNLSRACNFFSCARIWDSCCWSWICCSSCHNCCCTCHASCSKGSCAFIDSVSTSHSNRNLEYGVFNGMPSWAHGDAHTSHRRNTKWHRCRSCKFSHFDVHPERVHNGHTRASHIVSPLKCRTSRWCDWGGWLPKSSNARIGLREVQPPPFWLVKFPCLLSKD